MLMHHCITGGVGAVTIGRRFSIHARFCDAVNVNVMRWVRAVVGPVMPQVTGTWGHERWCEAQSRNYPLPCPGYWAHHKAPP